MNQACLGDVSSCEKQLLLLLYIIIIITTDTKHYMYYIYIGFPKFSERREENNYRK